MAEENKSAIESSEQTIAKGDIKELSENDVQALAETAQSVDKVLGLDNIKKFLDCFVNAKKSINTDFFLGTEEGKLRKIHKQTIVNYNVSDLALMGELAYSIIRTLSGKEIAYYFKTGDIGNNEQYITIDDSLITISANHSILGFADSIDIEYPTKLSEIMIIGNWNPSFSSQNSLESSFLKKVIVILPRTLEYDTSFDYYSNFEEFVFIGGKTKNSRILSNRYIKKVSKLILCTDTTECSSFSYMCQCLNNITDLSGLKIDTSNGTNFEGMFYDCTSLTDLSGLKIDTSNGTNFEGMFSYCTSLTDLSGLKIDTSNGTNFAEMFSDCTSLTDLSGLKIDTSNGTNFAEMFSHCTSLTDLSGLKIDTSNGTNFAEMFSYCTSLTDADLSNLDFRKSTRIDYLFGSNYSSNSMKLVSINFGDKFDLSNISSQSYQNNVFINCSSLTTLTGSITNIKWNLDISYSPLTRDSALIVINGLSSSPSASSPILSLSSSTKNLLTDDDIAIATSKGWTIA